MLEVGVEVRVGEGVGAGLGNITGITNIENKCSLCTDFRPIWFIYLDLFKFQLNCVYDLQSL